MKTLLVGVLLVLPACSADGDPIDLYLVTPVTRVRMASNPLEPIQVKLKRDTRQMRERGRRKILGDSYLRDTHLIEPTDVVLLKLIVRGLNRARVTRQASIRAREQPLLLELTVDRCLATYGEGLQNLLFVLPTSSIKASCVFELSLHDLEGRTFLKQRFEGMASGSGSPAGGLEDAAAAALARAMRKAIDLSLPAVLRAPASFLEQQKKQGADSKAYQVPRGRP